MAEQEKKIIDPNKWKPGKYKAKAIDWGVGQTKAGLPQVTVLFEYEQPGEMPGSIDVRQIMWFGSFKDKAAERTMEVLENLGLKSEPYPAMESGHEGQALDKNVVVEIVIEHRLDLNGNMRAGIAWVNKVGGRGLKSNIQEGQGTSVFNEANSAYRQYLEGKGVKVAGAKLQNLGEQIASGQKGMTEDDLPF